MPIYEMIETIILSFLHTGCAAGTFGTVAVSADDDGYNRVFTVKAAGRTFKARTTRIGWAVTEGHYTGEDRDLIEAARLAVTAEAA